MSKFDLSNFYDETTGEVYYEDLVIQEFNKDIESTLAPASSFKNGKNKFYHLHIPKTGGNYILEEVNRRLKYMFKEKNIWNSGGHTGWTYVTDTTFVFCAFREPVSRLVSQFNMQIKWKGYDPKVNIEDVYNPTIADLLNWVEANREYLQNFQTKSLFYYRPILHLPHIPEDEYKESRFLSLKLNDQFHHRDPNFLSIIIDKEEAIKKAKRIDLLVNTNTHLNLENSKKMIEYICNDFGVSNYDFAPYHSKNEPIEMQENPHNIAPKSKTLFESLSVSEIKFLEEVNFIDMEIYHTENLYWKSK